MALRTRADLYQAKTRIETTQIYRSSKTVYSIIGQAAPLNKPIVGRNAFLHESGIHQHGVLNNRQTYEILTPESVGIQVSNIVLGKHSGKHAFEDRLVQLGYQLEADELTKCFEEFKDLCDKKKDVTDADIEAIVTHNTVRQEEIVDGYVLDWFSVHTSSLTTATCTVSMKKDGEKFESVALGDGPIDAAFKAIDQIVKPHNHAFENFTIHSISEGKDTLGDVIVKLSMDGQYFTGKGLSTDILEASIVAYINAINKLCATAAQNEGKEVQ